MMQRLIEARLWHAVPRGQLADAAYAPPRRDWLLGEFASFFRQSLVALGASTYTAESGDCDDYAALYAALARLCHRRTPGHAGAGLPVGVVWYPQRTGGGHAVNVAITSDAGVIFIEPQTQRQIELTPEECSSARLVVL